MIVVRPVSTIQSRLLGLVALTAAVTLIATLTIGCGAKTGTRTKPGSAGLIVTPAARTSSPIVLPRAFPGRPIGSLSLRGSELVRSSARVLLSSADGSLSLIAGRSHTDRLCAGAFSPASGETAVRCLSDAERPPVIGFISITGRPRADAAALRKKQKASHIVDLTPAPRNGNGVISASVVGLADPSTARVVLVLQDNSRKTARLRQLPGLRWRVFSAGPYKNTSPDVKELDNLPNSLIALDKDGRKLSEIDLSWGYPDCQPDLCAYRRTKTGNWVIVRDPIASQQSAEISPAREQLTKHLLFSNAAVKQIISNRQYGLDALTYWAKCNGGMIGVDVDVLLTYPISIKGTLPYTTYENGTASAYLEGRASYNVSNVREISVGVDLNRRQVVSIDPAIGDDVTVMSIRPVGKLHPAGGSDTADCGDEGD